MAEITEYYSKLFETALKAQMSFDEAISYLNNLPEARAYFEGYKAAYLALIGDYRGGREAEAEARARFMEMLNGNIEGASGRVDAENA